MSDLQIIFPVGAFGANSGDSAIDTILRKIAIAVEPDQSYWTEKYGATFENDVFLMHRECWCEVNDGSCLWCLDSDHSDYDKLMSAKFGLPSDDVLRSSYHKRHYYDPPNFWFKPLDFRLCWYKYIGRDTGTNMDITEQQLKDIYAQCICSME